MFEFLSFHSSNDAINLIKADHDKVKELFDAFEKAESLAQKRKIAAETILELKLHTAIEEEIFYAAVRPRIEKKIMNEADEEHHVAKLLVAELERMNGSESHYEAKYKVLSENVRHHIKEEENDMLGKARELEIDYEAMGTRILARKAALKRHGFPEFGEEMMVANSRGQGDSPAKIADRGKGGVSSGTKNSSRVKLLPRVAPIAKAKDKKVVKFTKKAKSSARKPLKTAAVKRVKPGAAKKALHKAVVSRRKVSAKQR